VGIVDHDTIAGFKELREAAEVVGIPATCGYEQRIHPVGTEFMEMEINSPGNLAETYIAIHGVSNDENELLEKVRLAKIERFKKMIAFLNEHYSLGLSYDEDVFPLTECGNPTERHLSEAIARKIHSLCGEKGPQGIIDFTSRIVEGCNPSLPTRKAVSEETALNIEEFLIFIRNKVVTPLRKNFPEFRPTADENVSMEEAIEFAHKQDSLVFGLYLGGVTPCEAERRPGNLRRLFEYYKKMGIDGIAFMPNRNTAEEMEEVMALAKEIGFKYIANGMDVNKKKMPFTYFDISCRKDLVDVTMQIVEHEERHRRPQKEEERYAYLNRILRNITDIDQVPKNIIELLASALLKDKKVVLLFDENFGNKKVLEVFHELSRLKGDSNYAELLKNVIIPDPLEASRLCDEALKYDGEQGTAVFAYAPLSHRKNMAGLEGKQNIRPVYIDEKRYSLEYYHPLAEVVAISLADYLKPGTASNLADIFDEMGVDPSKINIDIKTVSRDGAGALIFVIIPNIKAYDHDGIPDRHERLKQAMIRA
jgi:hypothetical protein